MSIISLKPPLYILNIYVKLRALRLLKSFYKLPYIIKANETSLCFRHLKLYLYFYLIRPSSHCCVAVIFIIVLSFKSRAPRLLRPSFKFFRYQIGPYREALISFLGKALINSLWLKVLKL